MPDEQGTLQNPHISVVTPTLRRSQEVSDLIHNLSCQTRLPYELILVDGAPASDVDTEKVVRERKAPFDIRYVRQTGGTAIQRNTGIDLARGDFIAFIDDDIRLEPDFFELILGAFQADHECHIGGITGYILNQHLDPATSVRWRWNRLLRLYSTYEPGRYDFLTGYPINRYLQPLHQDLREVDFMGAGCAVWRRDVLETGLRFSRFFTDYGVLEDAHFALKAGREWRLLEHGAARCHHLKSTATRESSRLVARKTAINYRYVFVDIVPERTLRQEIRFWYVQLVDLLRFFLYALVHGGKSSWASVLGKAEGILAAFSVRAEEKIP